MNLSYRNEQNARVISAYFNKPLDKQEWFSVKAAADGGQSEIYIFDPIGWPWIDVSTLVRSLADMKDTLVRINTPGGDVFDAMLLYNALKNHPYKVTTRIESLAASAGSFIALAGKEVQAYQNSILMIHNSLVGIIGNQYDLKETTSILEKIDANMVDIYTSNSGLGKREMIDVMRGENNKGTWFTAKQAKDKGFVDTILEAGKGAKAQFDLSVFANVPDDLLIESSNRHEPTEREIERALRDVGVSQNRAKAILAGCKRAEAIPDDVIASFQNTLKIMGGSQWTN